MAGISTATGSERGSDGPRPEPVTPATDFDGCGACTWAPTATPRAAVPAAMSRAPAIPDTRARGLRTGVGGAAKPASARRRPRGTRLCAATPPMPPPFPRMSYQLA